jgi:hypothetical protein
MIEKRFSAQLEAFYRKRILPEEDRKSLLGDVEWKRTYRWFRSANIVPIEHYRRPSPIPQEKAS